MRRFLVTAFAAIAMAGMVSIMANAQDNAKGKGKGKSGPNLAPPINLTISGFADGGEIPARHTGAEGNTAPSPAMTWEPVEGAVSYAIILHDPDPVLGGNAVDVMHWGIFDIPGDVSSLPEGVPAGEQANGAKQMANITGQPVYFPPSPPAGNGYHHYTFEMYALNEMLGLPNGASRADVEAAMAGKVLAKRVYIGMFRQ